MLDWDIVWRGMLLSVVFLADVIVFADLAKEELREIRAQRLTNDPQSTPRAAMLRVFRKSPSPR